ncbi:MAG TPA: L-seryl-tRNA(Sec) selenium transferase [Dehalococcoidia bacterium]|nr:L-seryl-tRNA(Sec) selenium transferase [Dehalococcoidia bacterium]
MPDSDRLRSLPSVDRLLANEQLRGLANGAPQWLLTDAARDTLARTRELVAAGAEAPAIEELVAQTAARLQQRLSVSLLPVINATGVIIHTNLGRAPLSDDAIAAMAAVSRGYSNLEFDLEAGERGSRHGHVESLVCQLTGAEAAVAVNNNASALLLALSELCAGREVIVSRGQAVEIGGGFRIPDVLRQSGATLVEVGTTNRTYLRDYEAAITPETAAILRVHTSNFRVVGFTESVPLPELARLAHSRDLLLLDDLGSGCLLDTTRFGLAAEPIVQDSIAAGADLAFFSGDKLLGGPQAGIIAGRRELVQRLRRHPLMRAVRPDKASIAGLSATLLHYLRGEELAKVPVWRMIAMPLPQIERRTRRWARTLGPRASVRDGRSMVGGGSLPEESLPSRLLAIACVDGAAASLLAQRLRRSAPPVVARIEHDAVLLDPRTIDLRQDRQLLAAVQSSLRTD